MYLCYLCVSTCVVSPDIFVDMGICLSCFKDSSTDCSATEIVSAEARRMKLAEAAEKRMKEQESRGVKDPEKVKRQMERLQEIERRQEEASKLGGSGGLKWQVEN